MLSDLEETGFERISDKYAAGWRHDLLFSDWDVRVVLTYTPSVIASYNRKRSLHKMLTEKFGTEDVDWIIQTASDASGDDAIYLKSLGNLVMWKLQDIEEVKEHIAKVYFYGRDT